MRRQSRIRLQVSSTNTYTNQNQLNYLSAINSTILSENSNKTSGIMNGMRAIATALQLALTEGHCEVRGN